MIRTNVPCPANCKGYLLEVSKDTGRLFCDTVGCKFAFIDEHKVEHWVDGQMPLEVMEGNIES